MDVTELKQAGSELAGWERTMILSHVRPDGDALGSMAAMQRIITAAGRHATAFVYEELPERYRFVGKACDFETWNDDTAATANERFDGVLIVDTCSWSQLEPVAPWLRSCPQPRIVIDHHATRDDLAGEAGAEVLYAIDPSAASACALVHAWCEAMGWPIDGLAGEALLTGLTTDTGWFRFANTDGATLRAAAALVDSGARLDRLYTWIYETRSPARLRLMAEALSTLEFHADGALAIMWLTPEMFEFAGAGPADTEELVNEPMATRGVIVSILLADRGEDRVRVNFRSKAPEVCGVNVDVAALAKTFDGGGHHRAAGAWLNPPVEVARDQVRVAAVNAIEQAKRRMRSQK